MTARSNMGRARSSTIRAGDPIQRCSQTTPPTTFLPPLRRLSTASTIQLEDALTRLRALYFNNPAKCSQPIAVIGNTSISLPARPQITEHTIQDATVPDSGYASAEEDEDLDDDASDSATADELEVLRADPLERAFAIKWLTGFVARSEVWTSAAESSDDEDSRSDVLEEAVALLSLFNGNEEEEDVALTRTFRFKVGQSRSSTRVTEEIVVELNDAPLSKADHTSVGLQSWGSCILFAERICADAPKFGLCNSKCPTPEVGPARSKMPLRVLELGAGTGMLSIAVSKTLQAHEVPTDIVATDFHPDVLSNLRLNVETNFSPSLSSSNAIQVAHLDWEHPPFDDEDNGGVFARPFDVILAADIVYHPSHALWIKRVVERLLRRDGGVFWLFIPIRTTGRHEGVYKTVEALFDRSSGESRIAGARLGIMSQEIVDRRDGIGRADEVEYRLFQIGWIPC